MALIRKYATSFLLILFCWYYSGINSSSHIHIINGVTIAHSHPGAKDGHTHNEAQVALIDLLASFSAETPGSDFHIGIRTVRTDKTENEYQARYIPQWISSPNYLRGPPLAA